MTTRPRCAEVVWSHRGPDGWVPGHPAPCPHRARYLASIPSMAVPPTPICGSHANTGRWLLYLDTRLEPITPTEHA